MTHSPDSATPASLAGLRAGADVGGYRLLRRLGAGGMGVVWEAVDADGRHVAMKILHPQIAADPMARKRLDREAAVLARVKDSRVARILDIETGDGADGAGVTFVITELVDGPTLQSEVDHEGVYRLDTDIRDLSDLAHGLVDSLSAVHAAGVIHRDLKPSNVMLGMQGPVLIDFGIAQVADDVRLTQTGQVTGTPGFIPPEMLDGGEPTPDVDWYACAGVILFAITGRSPFGAGPWQAVFRRVYAGTPELGDLEETHPALARAFKLALAPDVADRLSVPELLEVLDEIADGGTGENALSRAVPDTAVDESDTTTGTYGAVAGPGYGAPVRPVSPSLPSSPTGAAAVTAASSESSAGTASGYGVVSSAPPGAYGFLSAPASQPDTAGVEASASAAGAVRPAPHAVAVTSGPVDRAVPPSYTPGTGAVPVRQEADSGAVAVRPPQVQPSPPQVQPSPQPGAVPEWALEPRRHRSVAAVFFLMLVALSLPIPGWIGLAFSLLVVIAGTVGRADDARRWRRLRNGYVSGTDNSRMWASMPWYLVRSLAAAAASCAVGALVAVVIFSVTGNALGFGPADSATVLASWSDYHRVGFCLVPASAAYMLVSWFIPWGAPTRRGGARMIDVLLSSRSNRLIGAAVFAAIALGVVLLFVMGAVPLARMTPFDFI
ncbi:protein kinase [Actinomyces sp. 594]|uniref:serine/threonine-protein kinase n=1 Tax=Actinomyces sp. 594 TaxID=2057793 RepID=UPI001C55B477|nr:serine/threonine-protein kinase [Actinomyces sp. 594]MBW3069207.1 protein kinase [Actinomyces sp. 594]